MILRTSLPVIYSYKLNSKDHDEAKDPPPSHLELQVMLSQCSLVYIDKKSTLSANVTKIGMSF